MLIQEKFQADSKTIRQICIKVEEKLISNGVKPDDTNDVIVSIDEALTNIFLHGKLMKMGNSMDIDLKIEEEQNVVHVIISDHGIPYDFNSIQIPNIKDMINGDKIGGLGVHLMKGLMDRVDYQRKENINILHMYKKITR